MLFLTPILRHALLDPLEGGKKLVKRVRYPQVTKCRIHTTGTGRVVEGAYGPAI